MHNFQPYPIDMLEFNPFKKIGTEWAAITAEAEGKEFEIAIHKNESSSFELSL